MMVRKGEAERGGMLGVVGMWEGENGRRHMAKRNVYVAGKGDPERGGKEAGNE